MKGNAVREGSVLSRAVRLLHELAENEDERVLHVLRIIYCLSFRVWKYLKVDPAVLCALTVNKLGSPQPVVAADPALGDLREHPRGGIT